MIMIMVMITMTTIVRPGLPHAARSDIAGEHDHLASCEMINFYSDWLL